MDIYPYIQSVMERKHFKKPDLHAPRNRSKIKDLLAYPDKDPHGFFERLKTEHPQLQQYSNRDLAKGIQAFLEEGAQDVVNNRKGVTLPLGLGVVMVGLCKLTETTAKNNIDYNTSNRLGLVVSYSNCHTEGYTGKIYYVNDIPRCRFNNHKKWGFKPCRNLSRSVSAAMKVENGYRNYVLLSKNLQAADLFRRPKSSKPDRKKVIEEEVMKRRFEQYDEFRFD